MTTEQEILEAVEARWGKKTLERIGLKLSEEAGEVSGALIKIPEGRLGVDDLKAEIGDVLIVLSQLAACCESTLEELRAARWQEVRSRY